MNYYQPLDLNDLYDKSFDNLLLLADEDDISSTVSGVSREQDVPHSAFDKLPFVSPFVSSDTLSHAKSILEKSRRSKSFDFELKRPAERSGTELINRGQGSTASLPNPKRAQTWQEISSEINRFAEENIKNAGWDVWTCKKKPQVNETQPYLSSQSPERIRKIEKALQDSLESEKKLQAWDKMMGLCHSRNMTNSSLTRKKLLQSIREFEKGERN